MVTLEKKSRREEEEEGRGEYECEKVNQGFNANEEQPSVKMHHIKTVPSSASDLPSTEEEEEVHIINDQTSCSI